MARGQFRQILGRQAQSRSTGAQQVDFNNIGPTFPKFTALLHVMLTSRARCLVVGAEDFNRGYQTIASCGLDNLDIGPADFLVGNLKDHRLVNVQHRDTGVIVTAPPWHFHYCDIWIDLPPRLDDVKAILNQGNISRQQERL
jgi:hypothetical protein